MYNSDTIFERVSALEPFRADDKIRFIVYNKTNKKFLTVGGVVDLITEATFFSAKKLWGAFNLANPHLNYYEFILPEGKSDAISNHPTGDNRSSLSHIARTTRYSTAHTIQGNRATEVSTSIFAESLVVRN